VSELDTIYKNAIVGGKAYLKDNPAVTSLVVGISGGIDSLVTAALAREVVNQMNDRTEGRPYRLVGYSLPIITNEEDEMFRARTVGELFCTNFAEVDLSKAFMGILPAIDNSLFYEMYGHEAPRPLDSRIRNGNLKARIRMMFLYDKAAKHDGMVLSTDNYTEYLLGFWTLHGDVGDFGFIQELWKTEVYALAEHIGFINGAAIENIVTETCEANATDGLGVSSGDLAQILPDWTGNSRNGYKEVDRLLRIWINGELDDEWFDEIHKSPVIKRHLASEFKRNNPANLDKLRLMGLIG
jgi:nicotinamide-nucleotide amidase